MHLLQRRRTVPARLLALCAAVAAAIALALSPASTRTAGAATYPNPETISGSTYAHDPSMIKTSGGRYYTFYTGGGIEILTSTDRTNWSSDGQVLPNGATWATAYGGWNDLWAPDVSYHNGVYLALLRRLVLRLQPLRDRPGHQHDRRPR